MSKLLVGQYDSTINKRGEEKKLVYLHNNKQ